MEIRISKELATALGKAALKPYGMDKEFDRLIYNKYLTLDISRFSAFKLIQLKNLIAVEDKVKGARGNLRDIATYVQGLQGNADTTTVNTVQQFANLLIKYLSAVPGHRVYQRNERRGAWDAYYVGGVEYHPPEKRRDYYRPAYTDIDLFHEEIGAIERGVRSWQLERVKGFTVDQVLKNAGLYVETPELRAEYLANATRFRTEVVNIGRQFLARGEATDDPDGNEKKDGWWWRANNSLLMDKEGEPSKVVIDVFFEEPDSHRDHDATVNHQWWVAQGAGKKVDDDEDAFDEDVHAPEEAEVVEDAADDDAVHKEEIPVHPLVVVFDLKRHLRLKLHIAQLEDYVYDASMGDKLVLPALDRELVDALLTQAASEQFQDIVAGKGGGHIILNAGPPGTGKTLTAEVYAEVAQRPLYSVQCAQLGITAEELEDALLKVLARGARWGAITLLDEADVYVAERGRDLQQNAIVGAFLRVLEYYKGVLFLTTNRPEMVDDAISSRCAARVLYTVPERALQARIWSILATSAGMTLKAPELKKITDKFGNLTGRDIKNLLKLCLLQSKEVTADAVTRVKRFKPTQDQGAAETA